LTLGVLCASAAFEISDQRRGRGILDSKRQNGAKVEEAEAPSHSGSSTQDGDLWKDMVAAEEQRLSKKHQDLYEHHQKHQTKPTDETNTESKPTEEESKPEEKESKSEDKNEKKDAGSKKKEN
jgi:hypothetical protein